MCCHIVSAGPLTLTGRKSPADAAEFGALPPARNKYYRLGVWGRAQGVALVEEGYASTEIGQRARKPPCGGRLGDHW